MADSADAIRGELRTIRNPGTVASDMNSGETCDIRACRPRETSSVLSGVAKSPLSGSINSILRQELKELTNLAMLFERVTQRDIGSHNIAIISTDLFDLDESGIS